VTNFQCVWVRPWSGVQNAAASTIMTIADMSLITAELKVDETDIVSVRINQQAEVTIDAMPNRSFHGHVVEIAIRDPALHRTRGVAEHHSEPGGKDFKVVIALDDPPDDIRPAYPAPVKYHSDAPAHFDDSDSGSNNPPAWGPDAVNKNNGVQARPASIGSRKSKKEEIQGVFVVRNGKADSNRSRPVLRFHGH